VLALLPVEGDNTRASVAQGGCMTTGCSGGIRWGIEVHTIPGWMQLFSPLHRPFLALRFSVRK